MRNSWELVTPTSLQSSFFLHQESPKRLDDFFGGIMAIYPYLHIYIYTYIYISPRIHGNGIFTYQFTIEYQPNVGSKYIYIHIYITWILCFCLLYFYPFKLTYKTTLPNM